MARVTIPSGEMDATLAIQEMDAMVAFAPSKDLGQPDELPACHSPGYVHVVFCWRCAGDADLERGIGACEGCHSLCCFLRWRPDARTGAATPL